MANDLSAFNSEAWSTRMVQLLDQVNVALQLVNRNWEGDLRQNKTVWVRTPGSITMSTYTRGTTISYEDLKPSKESFTVNDGSYFAFEVDDLDKAQSDISAMDTYLKRAIVSMSNAVETKIINTWVSNTPGANVFSAATAGSSGAATATVSGGKVTAITVGTAGSGYTDVPMIKITGGGGKGATAHAVLSSGTIDSIVVDNPGIEYTSAPTITIEKGTPLTLTSDSTAATGIYPLFCSARATLTKNNVPMQGRWALVDPDTVGLILQDTTHFIRATSFADQVVQSGTLGGSGRPGYIGRMAGFDVYETPHTHVDAVDGGKFIQFGDNDALSYAAQITQIEALRLQTTFADAIRGLLLHDTFVPAECTKRLAAIKAA